MLVRYSLASRSIVVTVNATVEPSGDNLGSPTAVSRPMSAGCIPWAGGFRGPPSAAPPKEARAASWFARFARSLGRSAVAGAQHRLSCRQTGDRPSERREGHVVEAGVVEEGDRLGVTAVLAADAELDVRFGLTPSLGALMDELAHTAGIYRLEGVALEQTLLDVGRHHAALDIVTAEAERHLGEVVGTEREEVGLLGDLVGSNGAAARVDHGADQHVDLLLGLGRLGGLGNGVLGPTPGQTQLLSSHRQRDHDLDDRLAALLGALGRRLHEGPHLHGVEPRLDDAEANAASAEHGVELVPRPGRVVEGLLLLGEPALAGLLDGELLGGRQELVQRRVEQTHGDGEAVHGLEDLLEVGLLDLAQLLERRFLLL